jgi:hypothetical protein
VSEATRRIVLGLWRQGYRPGYADPNFRLTRVVAVREKPEKPRKGRKRKRES